MLQPTAPTVVAARPAVAGNGGPPSEEPHGER